MTILTNQIFFFLRRLRIPFDKRSIVKLASTTEQNYYSSLTYVKKTLNMSTLSFDLLATRFGCPKTLQYLESMFEIFKNNWTKDLTNANIKAIDWNDDAFKVAIFWCVCKTFKVSIFLFIYLFFSSLYRVPTYRSYIAYVLLC